MTEKLTAQQYRDLAGKGNKKPTTRTTPGERVKRAADKVEATEVLKTSMQEKIPPLYTLLHEGPYLEVTDYKIIIQWEGRTFEFKEITK